MSAGSLDIFAYLEFSLRPLTEIPMAELRELHIKFMQQVIAPMQLPKAQALLEKHRAAGDRLLIITATNRFVVEPICHSLGVTELLAAEPEIADGRYTGKVVGTPTYQQGKVVTDLRNGCKKSPRLLRAVGSTVTPPMICRCFSKSTTRLPSTPVIGCEQRHRINSGRLSLCAIKRLKSGHKKAPTDIGA